MYRGAAVVEHGVCLHGGGGAAGVVGCIAAADVARISSLKSRKQVEVNEVNCTLEYTLPLPKAASK